MPPTHSSTPAAGYLGPKGTFSEEALLDSIEPAAARAVPMETIRDAIMAVQRQQITWSLVPIENSIEGSVTVTLDTLAGDAGEVVIVGETILPVRHNLIVSERLGIEEIDAIVSHPHVPGQCARFVHSQLGNARFVAASSTAEAVRLVAERTAADGPRWAAIGTRLAAELYGCEVIAESIQDREDNETRFVWLAHAGSSTAKPPPLRSGGSDRYKTSLVFWGAGADRAGWLVLCLDEFARRAINLTKIESRPMRERLGQYMFFVDLEGSDAEEGVADALSGVRELCEQVRVLGSYAAA